MVVEAGTPHCNRQGVGDVGYYAAAHAAFAGHADAEREVARLVVEPAGEHDGSEALCPAHAEDAFAVGGVDASVGEKHK